MRISSRLLLNSVANLVGGAVAVALALLLTPVLVHYLGRNAFGVWLLVGPITIYAPFIFLGAAGAINRFVAAYLAQGDHASINSFVNTALVFYRVGCLFLIGIGVTMAVGLPRWTNIEPSLQNATFWCVLILTTFQVLTYFYGPLGAVLYSLERFDLLTLTMVLSRVVRLAGVFLILRWLAPDSSMGLVIVTVVMGLTDAGPVIANAAIARRHCPYLKVDMRLARWEHFWPMVSFGLRSILWTIVTMLLPYTSLLLIGHYLSDADVTDYGIPERVLAFATMLVTTVVSATQPVAAKMAAKDSKEALRVLLLRSAKYATGIGLASCVFLGLLGPAIIKLWVGERFLHVANVLLILAGGRCLWLAQTSSFNVLFGMEKQGSLGIIGLFCVVVVGIAGIVVLGAYNMGLTAMAVVNCVTLVIGCGLIMPIHTCRKVGLAWSGYVRQVYLRSLLAATPLVVLCLGLRPLCASHAWLALGAGLLGGTVLAMATFWFWLFDDWDRELFRDRVGSLMAYLSRRTPSS